MVITIVNICILAATVTAIACLACKNRIGLARLLLTVGALALLPFGLNLACFMSKAVSHDLMEYAFVMLYILVLLTADFLPNAEGVDSSEVKTCPRPAAYRTAKVALCLAFAAILANGIIYANGAYLKRDLEYQATLSFMTRVIDRIEATEGYAAGQTPVIIIGTPETASRTGFERYATATGLDNDRSITYQIIYPQYFELVLGCNINVKFEWDSEFELDEAAIEDLPPFPAQGCIVSMGGALVVKLSG